MSSRGIGHYLNKRQLQYSQSRYEKKHEGKITDFDESFNRMTQTTYVIEKCYKSLATGCDVYLTPKSSDRMKRSVFEFANINTVADIDDQDQYKIAEAFLTTGNGYGSDTTLGAIYIASGEAQKDIIKAWLKFQFECERKYIKPINLFQKDLKEMKTNLSKLDRDRLYLDAQKKKSEKARVNIKKFDPTVIQHYNDKAARLQDNLLNDAGSVQRQMEAFFYDLEDDQLFIISAFIAAQLEFFRSSYETLQTVADFITQSQSGAIKSILGSLRQRKGQIQAVALCDFIAQNNDELSFLEGDVLSILTQDVGEGDWYEATLGGEVGLVPANFLRILENANTAMGEMLAGAKGQSNRGNGGQAANQAPDRGGDLERQIADERKKLEQEKAALKKAFEQQQKELATSHQTQQANMLKTMFDTAMGQILRQFEETLGKLEANSTASQSESFNPNPSAYENSQDGLSKSAQNIMSEMQSLMKALYSGDLIKIQEGIQGVALRSQEVALDGQQHASSLLDKKDREVLYGALTNVIGAINDMSTAVQPIAGQDKAAVKPVITPYAKDVANGLGQILDCFETSKENQALKMKELKEMQLKEKENSKRIANEQEEKLLQAARDIARVAQELAAIKSKNPTGFQAHKHMVEDAQGVTGAASRLIECATLCQRFISKAQNEKSDKSSVYFNDGTWSDGLVSAAVLVSNTVGELLDCSNGIVDSGSTVNMEKVDMLRAVAKSIVSGTVQVLTASASKNPDRNSQNDLKKAASELQETVSSLTKVLNTSKTYGGDDTMLEYSMLSDTQKYKAELEAQAKILKLERELELAHKTLRSLRQQKYKDYTDSTNSLNKSRDSLGSIPVPNPEPESADQMIDDDGFPPPPPQTEIAAGEDDALGIEDDLMTRLAKLRNK